MKEVAWFCPVSSGYRPPTVREAAIVEAEIFEKLDRRIELMLWHLRQPNVNPAGVEASIQDDMCCAFEKLMALEAGEIFVHPDSFGDQR